MSMQSQAARMVGTVLTKAYSSVKNAIFGADKSTVARVAKRVGLASAKATPQAIMSAMRNNKLSTALVLYELYGISDPILGELMDADDSVRSVIEGLAFTPDSVEDTTNVTDITMFTDEFAMISRLIARLGSLEAVMDLWNLQQLKAEHLELYVKFRDMGRSLN